MTFVLARNNYSYAIAMPEDAFQRPLKRETFEINVS